MKIDKGRQVATTRQRNDRTGFRPYWFLFLFLFLGGTESVATRLVRHWDDSLQLFRSRLFSTPTARHDLTTAGPSSLNEDGPALFPSQFPIGPDSSLSTPIPIWKSRMLSYRRISRLINNHPPTICSAIPGNPIRKSCTARAKSPTIAHSPKVPRIW